MAGVQQDEQRAACPAVPRGERWCKVERYVHLRDLALRDKLHGR
jgi:hypothetical protein